MTVSCVLADTGGLVPPVFFSALFLFSGEFSLGFRFLFGAGFGLFCGFALFLLKLQCLLGLGAHAGGLGLLVDQSKLPLGILGLLRHGLCGYGGTKAKGLPILL